MQSQRGIVRFSNKAELSYLTELSGIPQGSQGVGKLLLLELQATHDLMGDDQRNLQDSFLVP